MSTDARDLARGVREIDRRAIAKAISRVEAGGPEAHALLAEIHERVGRAMRLGVTGPPGAGKSTLVAVLAMHYRKSQARIGVIAVDPTSPFSGGALLGDRVRMTKLVTDPGVFIRSMASRGAFGGLARATWDAVDVLDAAGCDPVIVETVGVGQSEVEIAGLADTTVVVLSPESGDTVQAMKAGLMEVADVFVVNKSDREGAARISADVEGMLELRDDSGGTWHPPVLQASAQRSLGIDEIVGAIGRHGEYLRAHGLLAERRRRAIRRRILEILEHTLKHRFWTDERERALDALVARVYDKTTDPAAAAAELLDAS